jgi:hypothetical protein
MELEQNQVKLFFGSPSGRTYLFCPIIYFVVDLLMSVFFIALITPVLALVDRRMTNELNTPAERELTVSTNWNDSLL